VEFLPWSKARFDQFPDHQVRKRRASEIRRQTAKVIAPPSLISINA